MGHTFARSAFLNVSPETVAEGMVNYFGNAGIPARILPLDAERNAEFEARLQTSPNNWTIVYWPVYMGGDFHFSRSLSMLLETTVSVIRVEDEDYWVHGLFQYGRVVDLFASRPDFWEDDEDDRKVAKAKTALYRKKWGGNANAIASVLPVQPELVAPYLQHPYRVGKEIFPKGKAFPEDYYDITDSLVLFDFWPRLGIIVPEHEIWSARIWIDREAHRNYDNPKRKLLSIDDFAFEF